MNIGQSVQDVIYEAQSSSLKEEEDHLDIDYHPN